MGKQLEFRSTRRVVSIFFFIQGVIFATWASRIPDIKESLGLSEAALGSLLFSIPVGQICAMALSAWAVKRFESYRTMAFASLLSPLSLLPIGVASSPFALSVSLFLFGMCLNIYNISINTQGVDVERIFERNIMASFHGLWSLGGVTGGVASMLFASSNISVFHHFLSVAIFAIVVTRLFRRGLIPQDIKPEQSATEESATAPAKGAFWARLDPYILLLGVIAFSAMMCEGTMFDWSGIYFADIVEAPDNLVRLGYIVCMSTMTIGRFVSDSMKSRFGTIFVVRASGVLIAGGLMVAVLFPSLYVATIGFFFVGFGISSTIPICYSLAGRSKTISASVALASVSTIGMMGFLIGPPAIGFIAHAITLRWTFAVVAVVGFSITLMAGRLNSFKEV